MPLNFSVTTIIIPDLRKLYHKIRKLSRNWEMLDINLDSNQNSKRGGEKQPFPPSFIPKIESVLTSFFNAKNKEGEPVEIKKSRARNLRKGQLFVVRPLKMFCKWQRKNSNEVMLLGLLSFAWMVEKKPSLW